MLSAAPSGGSAYVGELTSQPAFVQDLPHDPGSGPIDIVSGAALAGLTVYAVVRPKFRFYRSIEGDLDDDP